MCLLSGDSRLVSSQAGSSWCLLSGDSRLTSSQADFSVFCLGTVGLHRVRLTSLSSVWGQSAYIESGWLLCLRLGTVGLHPVRLAVPGVFCLGTVGLYQVRLASLCVFYVGHSRFVSSQAGFSVCLLCRGQSAWSESGWLLCVSSM